MKRLKFVGQPGTALASGYVGSAVRFDCVGEEKDVEDAVADELLANFPDAFELVKKVTRTKSEDDEFKGKKPEKDRMKRATGRTRGRGK